MNSFEKLKIYLRERKYSLLIYYQHSNKRQYIGKIHNKKCRFCGRREKTTAFQNNAHALPESIGNKYIFSNEECDECNNRFSHLDNELGQFLYGIRTLCQIRGKKGIPKYKDNVKEIEVKNGTAHIICQSGRKKDIRKKGVEINNEKGVVIVPLERTYIPIKVYKCFCKMALSLMPLSELNYFDETIKWILSDEKQGRTLKNLRLYMLFIPGPHFDSNLDFFIIKNNGEINKRRPYSLFFVSFSNLLFQIYLPYCKKDVKKVLKKKRYYRSDLFGGQYVKMEKKRKSKNITNMTLRLENTLLDKEEGRWLSS